MKSFVRKSWSAVAMSMLAATGTVFAESHIMVDQSYQPYHDGASAYHDGSYGFNDGSCCPPSSCSPCGSGWCGSVPSRYGYAYNPPLFISDCCGWTAGIDILYWKFRQDGISYGNQVNLTNVFSSDSLIGISGNLEGQQKYVEQNWDVGFRLAVGYKGSCDCWDLLLTYTHFEPDHVCGADSTSFRPAGNGTGSAASFIGAGSVFLPSYSAASGIDVAGAPLLNGFEGLSVKAEADLKLRFDQLDLDASRQFYVGRCVTFKPIVGLRALWLDEKYGISYTFAESNATTGTTIVASANEALRFDNEFRGLGLKAGFDATYAFGCGLSVYGSATGAIVYGTFDVKQRDQFTFTLAADGSSDSFSYQQKDHYNTLLPAADLGLGIQWTQLFNCDKSAFTLRIGYEQHIVFDYNRFRQLDLTGNSELNNNPSGDLSLYGVVFGAHVGF